MPEESGKDPVALQAPPALTQLPDIPPEIDASFRAAANKYYWLQDYGEAMDLYNDIVENVWTKTVRSWPTYQQKSENPDFKRWAWRQLRNYLIDMKRRYHTGPRKLQREMLSLEKPILQEEGETELKDVIEAEDTGVEEWELGEQQQKIIDAAETPEAKEALRLILDWRDPDSPRSKLSETSLWRVIQRRTGKSKQELLPLLQSNPVVLELLQKSRALPEAPAEEPKAPERETSVPVGAEPQPGAPEESLFD